MAEIKYVCCFNCGHATVLSRLKPDAFDIEPSDFFVFRVREQVGGRSRQGFFDIPEKARTITELVNSEDPEEKEVGEILKRRLLTIVRSYIEAGVVTKDELAS